MLKFFKCSLVWGSLENPLTSLRWPSLNGRGSQALCTLSQVTKFRSKHIRLHSNNTEFHLEEINRPSVLFQQNLELKSVIFNWPQDLTSFPSHCQTEKWQQPTEQEPSSVNQNYTYLFLSNQQKIYFLVCRRMLVISLCVPGDEKGWKSPI